MRKIEVQATPRAKKPSIKLIRDGFFQVSVTEPPVNGNANAAVEKAIAEYFKIPPSLVITIQGKTGRHKILQLPDQI